MKNHLSKSKLMSFLQCPRRLYLEVHRPELAEESADSQARMAAGIEVGEVARTLRPGGVLVGQDGNLAAALEHTHALLARAARTPLFEATFQHDAVLVRADLLTPNKKRWDLIEVKAAVDVKDHYYPDVAIQAFVLQGAGVALERVVLQHINREFVYPGGGCYHEVKKNGAVNSLFTESEVTQDVAPLLKEDVPQWIRAARQTLRGDLPPMTDHCDDPVECPFQGYCHKDAPEYPISCLPYIGKKRIAALQLEGYQDIRDIPPGVLEKRQEWVRRVTVSGKPELRKGARASLTALSYPRYYLDFETIQFAVPIWKGTRPYQQIPFQWSCHSESRDGRTQHQAFLDLSGEDPRRAFAQALLEVLRTRGPIMVYSVGFEGRVVRELAQHCPDLADDLLAIIPRFVDLLPIAREHYYHPLMAGSWSIKAVLPTIAPDLDYATLDEVQDGGQAQQAYLEAIAHDTTPERKKALKKALLAYCGRDTEGLVLLARFLAKFSKI